jgi:hypothetical protein
VLDVLFGVLADSPLAYGSPLWRHNKKKKFGSFPHYKIFKFLVIKNRDSDPDPPISLDLDPDLVDPDPKFCLPTT